MLQPGSEAKARPPGRVPWKNMAFLRPSLPFLVPSNSLDLSSMLGVFLRTIVRSLLTWLPLLTFLASWCSWRIFTSSIRFQTSWIFWSPISKLIPDAWHESQPPPAALKNV